MLAVAGGRYATPTLTLKALACSLLTTSPLDLRSIKVSSGLSIATMAVPRSRILDLLKAQSRIFNTTFNPTNARLGNSVLRERLRGPSLAAYYPRRVATFKDLRKLYPEFELYDNFEEDRLEHIQISKSRGKGAPKKKRTAAGEYLSRLCEAIS